MSYAVLCCAVFCRVLLCRNRPSQLDGKRYWHGPLLTVCYILNQRYFDFFFISEALWTFIDKYPYHYCSKSLSCVWNEKLRVYKHISLKRSPNTCIQPFHSSVWSLFKSFSGVCRTVNTNATITNSANRNTNISREYCFSVLGLKTNEIRFH